MFMFYFNVFKENLSDGFIRCDYIYSNTWAYQYKRGKSLMKVKINI